MAKIAVYFSLVVLIAVIGVGISVTHFTSYLGNDPNTCNNCHVMDAAYEGWYHAAHHSTATCNDCHTPHDLIPKYFTKAKSGANHVFHFTLGLIPEPLRAKPATDKIIQANCIRCHQETIAEIGDGQMAGGRYCFECHRSVAHGERGIAIRPFQEGEE